MQGEGAELPPGAGRLPAGGDNADGSGSGTGNEVPQGERSELRVEGAEAADAAELVPVHVEQQPDQQAAGLPGAVPEEDREGQAAERGDAAGGAQRRGGGGGGAAEAGREGDAGGGAGGEGDRSEDQSGPAGRGGQARGGAVEEAGDEDRVREPGGAGPDREGEGERRGKGGENAQGLGGSGRGRDPGELCVHTGRFEPARGGGRAQAEN